MKARKQHLNVVHIFNWFSPLVFDYWGTCFTDSLYWFFIIEAVKAILLSLFNKCSWKLIWDGWGFWSERDFRYPTSAAAENRRTGRVSMWAHLCQSESHLTIIYSNMHALSMVSIGWIIRMHVYDSLASYMWTPSVFKSHYLQQSKTKKKDDLKNLLDMEII